MIDSVSAILAFCIFISISLSFVIFSQRSKLRSLLSKNISLAETEILYRGLLLEKARLEERCLINENTSKKYNELLDKYCELEKKAVFLTTSLDQERKNLQEKVALLENAEQKLSDTFKSISMDALSKNNANFMNLAKTIFEQFQEKAKHEFSTSAKNVNDLISPIKKALEGVDEKLSDLEKSRIGAYEALKQQVGDLITTQNLLKNETGNLVSALRAPSVRGRWGEMQLRRVVEIAGMIEHCDFKEQVTTDGKNGEKIVRPDMVIYLPGGQEIIVDAKAPLGAYLEAIEISDEKLKKNFFKDHARHIRNHVTMLSGKKYWSQFEKSPEFVILFLPGEIFFSVATEHDPSLIEFAMQERVIISTPTILLALLHTIALGWRQENLAENAKHIIKMGQELYKRLSDMTQHIAQLGRSINSTVQSYNSTIASLESRVLVSARKFKDFDVHEKNIIELSTIEGSVRAVKEI